MRVLVVGSGGREHALALALGRTADVAVCPGNAGMAALGIDCVLGPPESFDADLTVIGPEAPLVEGLADRLRALGRTVFGPGADGARLEGSKAWMKEVLSSAGVPTAAYGAFGEVEPALEFLRSLPPPWVVKTDGLAAGKGVLVTYELAEAEVDLRSKLSGAAFGNAGRRVVVEEGLIGPEVSLMAVCDGVRAIPLAPAQDFKRVADGDAGANTGGMGAYSPVPAVDGAVIGDLMDRAVSPTLQALKDRGIDFRGVLYAGVILTGDGPKILEFNVRFGDPESQVVLPRWQGDVTALLAAAAAGRLEEVPPPSFSPEAAVAVVLAAPGYPTDPRLGGQVRGLLQAAAMPGVTAYPAGLAQMSEDGGLVTSGGRVLALGATGASIDQARTRAYAAISKVSWPGMQYRNDIAAEVVVTTGGR